MSEPTDDPPRQPEPEPASASAGALAVAAAAERVEAQAAPDGRSDLHAMVERDESRRQRRNRTIAIVQVITGLALLGAGLAVTSLSFALALPSGGRFVLWYGPIGSGLLAVVRGMYGLFADTSIADDRHLSPEQLRRRATRDLAVGALLVVAPLAVALASLHTEVWGRGLFTLIVGLLAIGLALLARALVASIPEDDRRVTIGAAVIALAGLATAWACPAPLFRGATRGELTQLFALYAAAFVGIIALAECLSRLRAGSPVASASPDFGSIAAIRRRRFVVDLSIGVVLLVAGITVSIVTYRDRATTGKYVIMVGPIIAGLVFILRALMGGFKSFVAWRYLLVFNRRVTRRAIIGIVVAFVAGLYLGVSRSGWLGRLGAPFDAEGLLGMLAFGVIALGWGLLRHSRPSFWMYVTGVALAIGCAIVLDAIQPAHVRGPFDPPPEHAVALQVIYIGKFIGVGLAALAAYFGTLRAFFTFFTVIPIVGVWIGTSALVMVLAVMSGFETDLRDKILGSNAHIQITREDGEFTDWRAAKAKIDAIPGIVASTPFAVSEVVIAANNNGMNVIVKGIDAATVGAVTNLVANLEDKDALDRLEPLVPDEAAVAIPQHAVPPQPDPGAVDPPPPDLLQGGEPADYSGGAAPDAADGSDGLDGPDGRPSGVDRPAPYVPVAGDVPPDDLLTTEIPPTDYSAADAGGSGFSDGSDGPDGSDRDGGSGGHASDDDTDAIDASDLTIEPVLSGRTKSLSGILVGKELVKQTHMYPGQSVRLVSPLSDPANPDATGTPIPYNRDYRVAGVFFTGMYEYDLKYVYVTLDSLQQFLDRGDAVDGIEVRVTDADDTGRYVPNGSDPGLIASALGSGYRVQDWRELNRSLFSALKLEKIAMFLVLGIVILVASFSIVGNLIMVVVEKQREIALLKTLGASDASVTQLFAIQGLIIGLIGTAIGIATGLAGCWAGKRFGLPLNEAVYYIDKLPIHVDPESVGAAAVAGVAISIAATLYPAFLASRVRPAAGMRH